MFPYTNQTSFSKMSCNYLYNHDSEHDQNPNSTTPQEEEEDPPFSLHNFPSPFLDDNQLFFSHIFPHHHHHQQLMAADQNLEANISTTEEISSNTNTTTATTADHQHHPSPSEKVAPKLKRRSTNNNKNKGPTQRKSGKKDRHSKIYTAQGLRDRRMRLSLQIARKFFDLQDMLGFDKASKTIDWLFSKSRKAIKQLSCTTNRMVPQINNTMLSSTSSECEVESEEIMRKVVTPSEGENFSNEKKTQKLRKGNSIAKEFRDKARARARERTREKMMIRCLEKSNASYNSIQLASAGNPNSLFETGEESMSCLSQDSHSSLHHQLANVGIIDNFLGTTASSSAAASCSIFDYQKNDAIFSGGLDSYSNKFLGFLGNWDLNSNNSAMASNMVLTGKAPTSVFMENSSYHHFQSQNQAD